MEGAQLLHSTIMQHDWMSILKIIQKVPTTLKNHLASLVVDKTQKQFILYSCCFSKSQVNETVFSSKNEQMKFR